MANCYCQFVTLFKEKAAGGGWAVESCALCWPTTSAGHSSRFYRSCGRIREESMTARLGLDWQCYETSNGPAGHRRDTTGAA